MGLSNHFLNALNGEVVVNHFRYTMPFRTPEHAHDEYTIIGLFSGSAEYTQFHQREHVGRGEVLITNGSAPHSSRYVLDGQPTEGIALTLPAARFHAFLEESGVAPETRERQCLLLGKICAPQFLPLMDALIREMGKFAGSPRLLIDRFARELALAAISNWPRGLITEDRARRVVGSVYRQTFIRALEFMHSASRSEFSIGSLCSTLGISRRQLYAMFQTTAGGTPGRHFNEVLMQRAEQMLGVPGTQVKAVAYELGFHDPRDFRESFRRLRQAGPSAFLNPVR
jgi:AraC-like DNA-binding protein